VRHDMSVVTASNQGENKYQQGVVRDVFTLEDNRINSTLATYMLHNQSKNRNRDSTKSAKSLLFIGRCDKI